MKYGLLKFRSLIVVMYVAILPDKIKETVYKAVSADSLCVQYCRSAVWSGVLRK